MPSGTLSDDAGALASERPLALIPAPPRLEQRGNAENLRRSCLLQRNAIFRRLLACADLVATASALAAGAVVFGDDSLTLVGSILAFLIVIIAMKTLGLYDRDEHLIHKATLDELPRLFEVATLSSLLLWLGGDVVVAGDIGRRQILGMWFLLLVLFVVLRSLARFVAVRVTPVERCLLLGDAAGAKVVRSKLAVGGSMGAELVGWLPLERREAPGGGATSLTMPANLESTLTNLDVHRIILAPGRIDGDSLVHAVRKLRAAFVSVSVMPATPQVAGSSVELDQIHGLTLLGVRNSEIGRSSKFLKRTFDAAVSALLLGLLSPILLAVAIAIRLDSRGPSLFRQVRIGRDGEPFLVLKFRSMELGAELRREDLRALNEADGLFKIERDPRVTRVGRILRRRSLDELPQLINVLRGEMSLVGPRPLVPDEDSQIEGHFRRRLDLAPGMTGYWQAHGGSRIPLSEMQRLDYLYVANWSLWQDLRIMLWTIPFVFGGKGR